MRVCEIGKAKRIPNTRVIKVMYTDARQNNPLENSAFWFFACLLTIE